MRTTCFAVIALLLSLGGGSAAGAQAGNAHRFGVTHEQLPAPGTAERASRDTADVTPTDHPRSNVRVGAITGAVIAAAITILVYKNCADSSPQSDKGPCGTVLIVSPVVIGVGALIGGLLGRALSVRD